MKRLLLTIIFLLSLSIIGLSQSNPPLKIKEVDGSPSQINATELIFPNGTLTRSGSRITFSISGGGFISGSGTNGRLAQFTGTNTLGNATSPLPSSQGGTNNAFFAVSGPATSTKTFTFPNASATVLTTNATITVAQGGTGAGTFTNHGVLLGQGTSNIVATSVGSTGTVLKGVTGADPAFSALDLTTDVTGALPSANGGVAVVDTADQGFWCPIASGIYSLSPGAGVISGTNNQVKVIQVVLRYKIVIGRATLEVTTAGAGGSTVTLGIYSANGNTKLLDTGTFNGNSATIQTITFSTVTLNPGTYFFVWSVSDATIQARLLSGNTQWNNIIYNNQTVKKVGSAANATSGGVLPTTLGLITGANLNAPLAVFER